MWQFAHAKYRLCVAKRFCFHYQFEYTRNKCLGDNASTIVYQYLCVLREWLNTDQILAWGSFLCYQYVWVLRDCKTWWLKRLIYTASGNITKLACKNACSIACMINLLTCLWITPKSVTPDLAYNSCFIFLYKFAGQGDLTSYTRNLRTLASGGFLARCPLCLSDFNYRCNVPIRSYMVKVLLPLPTS
jgi:hypothetical protein